MEWETPEAMSRYRKFTTICCAAALAFGLAACGSSSDDDTADTTPPVVTPPPDPEPMGPTDLEETQTAAAAAATAAMTASTNAETAAAGAETATMHIATLQTNGKAMMYAMDARKYADMAMAEYMKANAASKAAAAATTGDAGEAAWRMAVTAQEAAEGAAEMATANATKAEEAAMTELHINGTMKSAAGSSLDASSGELRTPTAGGGLMITGTQLGNPDLDALTTRDTDLVPGVAFLQNQGSASEVKYKQAIADGNLTIGKVVDSTDDAARLTIITAHQGKKTVRVFVDGNGAADDDTLDGLLGAALAGLDGFPLGDTDDTTDGVQSPAVKSIGMYYKAEHYDNQGDLEPANEDLGALDRVTVTKAKGVELFELSDGTNTHYARVVETVTDDAGVTTRHYQPVDIVAEMSKTDGDDSNAEPDDLRPTVSIPVASDYSHIHFGVWAGLGAAKKTGAQELADLGTGFVQNIDGSGMTDRQGIGEATFNGNWVAAVRRQYASDAEAGAIKLDSGSASLTADFETGKFMGALMGLATLEGTLANNGFSGMTAKAITHDDLDPSGTFAGEFSGGIYGPTGSEAAGVFDFDGGEAGAFRGAFGGAQ